MRYDRMGIGRVRPEEDEDGPGGDDGDRGKDGAGGGGFGPGEDVSRVSFEGGGAVCNIFNCFIFFVSCLAIVFHLVRNRWDVIMGETGGITLKNGERKKNALTSVPIFQVPSFSIGRVLANQMAGSRQFRHGQGLDFLHVD
mmetsp:Transcript_2598/g.5288  ORF Transcript_2598/g.5288 Transcript_2598/m.5288 type:complete len:141 (+) Transcript_2598:977-1399(+)